MTDALGAAAAAGLAPTWALVGPLALLAAWLALDETALAQTWLSQPLPAGLLAGLVAGEPAAGLAVGLPLQLVTLSNLPVGQVFAGDRATAVVAAVGAAVLGGRRLEPLGAPAEAGEPGLLGWMLAAAALVSLAGNLAVRAERRIHFAWMLAGHRTLRDGRLERFDRLQARCLALTAMRGLLLCPFWIVVLVWLWLPILPRLPARLAAAFDLLPWLALPLGIAAMIDLHGWRAGWKWLTAGAAAALAVGRWLG